MLHMWLFDLTTLGLGDHLHVRDIYSIAIQECRPLVQIRTATGWVLTTPDIDRKHAHPGTAISMILVEMDEQHVPLSTEYLWTCCKDRCT